MRRHLPLIIVIIIIFAGAMVWMFLGPRHKSHQAVTPAQPAQPLTPQPAYLQTANDFMAKWAAGDSAGVYAMLADSMKKVIGEKDFAGQLAEVKLSNPHAVAHTGISGAAYVIMRVVSPQPQGATPINGYSLLLCEQDKAWKVALFVAEEKVADKYTDLKIAPGKDKGYTVTWQDEKGQVATVSLQEL